MFRSDGHSVYCPTWQLGFSPMLWSPYLCLSARVNAVHQKGPQSVISRPGMVAKDPPPNRCTLSSGFAWFPAESGKPPSSRLVRLISSLHGLRDEIFTALTPWRSGSHVLQLSCEGGVDIVSPHRWLRRQRRRDALFGAPLILG